MLVIVPLWSPLVTTCTNNTGADLMKCNGLAECAEHSRSNGLDKQNKR